MKKLLAVLLSLALLMSLVPLGAITASADSLTVYVGGKLLPDGIYLTNSGSSLSAKPTSGGFAHLSGSTLILYNYSYTGSGMSIGGGADCTSAVYAIGDLTVSLYGDNTLNMNNTADSYAIYTTGALTINEDAAGGNLTISNCTRGINCNGSVVFSGGTTTIAAKDYGIYCNNTFGITKGKLTITAKEQHGIYTKYALIVGGNIDITAKGIGINASGTYGQSGGIVTIDAVSAGILSISTFKQTGGELYITSDSNAVSSISDVTFSGGFFDIKSTTIRALVGKTVTFTNMAPKASTTADGSLTDYVAANIANYKRIAYLADVYVGGVGLVNGQYLATGSARATTTKPSGGYAYYNNGTLTLNNYAYSGEGYSVPAYSSYTALVYSEKALTVKLVGTNTLTNSIDSAGVGIWVHNEALTIIDGGSGALNMTVKDDGIYTYDDDINIQGGAITITADDYGIYSYTNLTISGGTINVDSGADGICASYGDVTIFGGTVTVTADYSGIYSDGNITISGGTVIVNAEEYGIYSDYGDVSISGGELDVTGDEVAIDSDNIVLDGVTLRASTTKDGTLVDYVAANNDTYKRVVTAPTYSVIFYFGGDPLFGVDIEEGKTVEEPAEPAQDCKIFLGWYLGDTKYDFSKPVTQDIVLVATFKENHTYSNACDKSCNVCGNTRSTTHSYKTTTTKATLTKNGKIVKQCTSCGYIASQSTIRKIGTISLSGINYAYSGKVITPKVVVKNSAGTTISSRYYTVSYQSGRKNVGQYRVTIRFKGYYSGTRNLYFNILPPKTTVSRLAAGKKSFTATITKKSAQVTGYQLQYSTNKKFSGAKTITIRSYKTTKQTIRNLYAKKYYYVRVRTYKTVGGKNYYSGWSTYKYVKTK